MYTERKYMVLFCDVRGMKVLRDEKGRKSAAFGACLGPQTPHSTRNRKVPKRHRHYFTSLRKEKSWAESTIHCEILLNAKVVSRYRENIKTKFSVEIQYTKQCHDGVLYRKFGGTWFLQRKSYE